MESDQPNQSSTSMICIDRQVMLLMRMLFAKPCRIDGLALTHHTLRLSAVRSACCQHGAPDGIANPPARHMPEWLTNDPIADTYGSLT